MTSWGEVSDAVRHAGHGPRDPWASYFVSTIQAGTGLAFPASASFTADVVTDTNHCASTSSPAAVDAYLVSERVRRELEYRLLSGPAQARDWIAGLVSKELAVHRRPYDAVALILLAMASLALALWGVSPAHSVLMWAPGLLAFAATITGLRLRPRGGWLRLRRWALDRSAREAAARWRTYLDG